MSYVTHSIIDRSGEVSFTRHYLPAINAGNYAAITGNTVAGNVGRLRLALAGITNGNFVQHTINALTTRTLNAPAIDPNAQRELKVILRFRSSAGRAYSVEIPGPDLTGITTPGTDVITPNVAWQTFIVSITDNFTDSFKDSLTFIDGRVVGRKL